MKTNKRYPFWKVFWAVLGWFIFIFIISIIADFVSPMGEKGVNWQHVFKWSNIASTLLKVIFYLFFFYFTLNAFYRLFARRAPLMSYVRHGIPCLVTLAAYHYFSFKLEGKLGLHHLEERQMTGLLIFNNTLFTLFQMVIVLAIAYLTYLVDEKQRHKLLEEQKMQLEVEKSQANFNFLKAQINPHFLHNTLNFLYAKSLPYSPELSEGILTLSDIMRYALSEGNARDGKAPLKDEVEHMRNVIKINQLRFSNTLHVQFDVEGMVNGATIIPFVLITLVENAFKHGDLKSPEHPIEIRLTVQKNSLHFTCRNKKKQGPKELSTGIGLLNIRNRLDLAYGKDYSFIVNEDADFYTTELTINPL